MKPPYKILFLFGGSLTEARGLLPLYQEFGCESDVKLSCLVTRHISKDIRLTATQALLREHGIEFCTTGIDAPVNARKILEHYIPDVVVMANDCLIINRHVLRSASSSSIPTLLIQEAILNYVSSVNSKRSLSWLLGHMGTAAFLTRAHLANGSFTGWWSTVTKTLFRRPLNNRAYGFGNVSVFCVLSEFDAENFLKCGSQAQRIVVTGIPGLFDLHKAYVPSYERVYDFVLFTTCESLYYMTRKDQFGLYRDIVSSIRQAKPEAKIALKLHPQEDRRTFNELKGVELIDSVESALMHGKVMIGTVSSVLFETLLSGFPTIMYLPRDWPWLDSFLTDSYRKLGIVAHDKGTLAQLLERSIEGLEQEPAVIDFRTFWRSRLQNSAISVKNIVLELCQSHQSR